MDRYDAMMDGEIERTNERADTMKLVPRPLVCTFARVKDTVFIRGMARA